MNPQLISVNSFELNTAASLSDDSGFAHSISSGSSRARFENEVNENLVGYFLLFWLYLFENSDIFSNIDLEWLRTPFSSETNNNSCWVKQ